MRIFLDKKGDKMRIIYETETGISIIHPSGELSIEKVFDKDVPEQYKSTAKIVEDSEVPDDRTFRNAWKLDKDKIVEDVSKSKEIHKEKLRAERKSLLEEQDVLYMKALENGSDTASIIAEKQRLRDITKQVDLCETIDDIKKVKL
jgi:hypothetical protein